ncbi:adenosylhomocysteinase [Microbacterium sp. GXS0129]|uniref:adenosylhomocysteinase n=1 Tax=Microbacterium sp. GXS0129 TaxID=3377836 RepID=UPI00383A1E16
MHEAPERIVRRFAAAGNLVVSGQPTAVVPDDDRTAALRDLLRRLGAVICGLGDAAYVYADGDTGVRLRGDELVDGAVVIECGDEPAFEAGGQAQSEPTRDPFRAFREAGRLVRVLPARAVRTPVADISDADARLQWAHDFMSACAVQTQRLGGMLTGTTFGISMVLEPKTANLALFLREAGARVVLYAHADETDPAIAEALRRRGFTVHASTHESRQLANARAFLAEGLDFLLDDGAHLIRLALLDGVPLRGAAEETTSGLRPLRAMGDALTVPVVAVNDARMKTRFDNRYGTGQSCVFAIADLLDGIGRGFGGSPVTVIGYGPVGEGVAQHVRALGGDVTVVETDPVRELEARSAGYVTGPAASALARGGVVISATGMARTVPVDLLRAAPSDTVFAVAGGVIDEIDLSSALSAGARWEPELAPKVERLRLDASHAVVVLDRGGCINITAAEGNPVQIMDYSFAAQLAAARLLAEGAFPLPGVFPLPPSEDEAIAAGLLDRPVPAPSSSVPTAVDWLPARFPDARPTPAPTRESDD